MFRVYKIQVCLGICSYLFSALSAQASPTYREDEPATSTTQVDGKNFLESNNIIAESKHFILKSNEFYGELKITNDLLGHIDIDIPVQFAVKLPKQQEFGIEATGNLYLREIGRRRSADAKTDAKGTKATVYYQGPVGKLSYGIQAGNTMQLSAAYAGKYKPYITELVSNPLYLTAPMLPTQYYAHWFEQNYNDLTLGDYAPIKVSYLSNTWQGLRFGIDYWLEDPRHYSGLTDVVSAGLNYTHKFNDGSIMLSLVGESSDVPDFKQGVHSLEVGAKLSHKATITESDVNINLGMVYGFMRNNADLTTNDILRNPQLTGSIRVNDVQHSLASANLQLYSEADYYDITLGITPDNNNNAGSMELGYFSSNMNGFRTTNIRASLNMGFQDKEMFLLEFGTYRLRNEHNYADHLDRLSPVGPDSKNIYYVAFGVRVFHY